MTALRTKLTMLALLVCSVDGTAMAADPGQPAVWSPHEMIIDLQNLPQPYSCNDLWYKFKDVLHLLGARADMTILPYGCESALGAAARSPKVQLKFYTPRIVSSADARYADLKAVTRNVRLQSGEPARIDSNDCVLLSQIKGTLLPQLGDRVVESKLACGAPQSTQAPFGLTVQALVPLGSAVSMAANQK